MNETVAALSKMQNAVDIPILADGEGGYGSALNVIRMIREYEKTGIGVSSLKTKPSRLTAPSL